MKAPRVERDRVLENKSPKQLQQMVLDYLNQRFGLAASLFDCFGLYLASKGRVYLGPKSVMDKPRAATLGLLIARISGAVKPTTNLFQIFGNHITKNTIQLTRDQTLHYARGMDLQLGQLSDEQVQGLSDGYVLLKYQNFSLGCGLLMLKQRTVKNMLPKAKRLELKFV